MIKKSPAKTARRARPLTRDEALFRKIKIARPAVRPDRATIAAIRKAVKAMLREQAV